MCQFPHDDLLQWWKKESQRNDLSVQELGEILVQHIVAFQKYQKAQQEKSFQREQKLFSRIERGHSRMKTLEERVELQIEMEVEEQKIIFSSQVDRAMEAHRKLFLEIMDTMLQSFQDALRDPKGGDTLSKEK